MTTLSIDVTLQHPAWKEFYAQHEAFFEQALQHAFAELDFPSHDFSVSIVLMDDKEIRILNRDYRHKDKATNVLSFPMFEDFSDMPDIEDALELGDVILAYETIVQEAIDQEKPLRDHVAHLLVHGFLHLCGFDHMTPEEEQEMEALEIDILHKIGIADPYA